MNYWEDRALRLEESTNAIAKKSSKELQKLVDTTYRDIKKDLDAWLYRLAVTVEDKPDNYVNLATELLKKDELDAFHWTLEEYIKRAKSKDDKWLKAVEQASANYHITKLTEYKMLLEMQYNELLELQKDKTFEALKEVYNDRYLKTAYDMQRFMGKFSIINPADDYFIKALMNKSWLPDGKNISSRIWKNKRGTVDKLMEVIHSCGVSGKHPLQYSKDISQALGMCSKRDKYCIDRLLLTESAYVSSVATFENYKDMEVEKYQILATLDSKTSDICRDLDGKIFKIEDYKVGITAPPFHPHCRTTTAPYDEEWEDVFNDNIPFDEWVEKYADNTDYMGLSKVVSIDGLAVKVHKLYDDDIIYTQRYNKDVEATAKYIKGINDDAFKDVSEIRIINRKGIVAGYDRDINAFVFHEKFVNDDYINKILGSGNFASRTREDILCHELSHKLHWDRILKLSSENGITINEAKHRIEYDLNSYINRALHYEPLFLENYVSLYAYKQYKFKGILNEVISEVMVRDRQGKTKDEELLKLVKEVLGL